MIHVFKAEVRDMGHATTLEIRTQEFPLLSDEVKTYFMNQTRSVYLAKLATQHIGSALVTFDHFGKAVKIDSVGTHPEFRRVGVARKIIDRLGLTAHAEGRYDCLRILVPSYAIEDKTDPWNIEHVLWKWGFKAKGEVPGGIYRYGKDYGLYIFERQV